jgi:hypothetical protein
MGDDDDDDADSYNNDKNYEDDVIEVFRPRWGRPAA